MMRLRELRQNRYITIKELSRIMGISESAISLYEHGKRQPDYETVIKFADYFNVSVDYLLGRTISIEESSPALTSRSRQESKSILKHTEHLTNPGRMQLTAIQRL